MQIWVDADACPVVVKEVLFRAAERLQVPMTLVAMGKSACLQNHSLRTSAFRF